MTANERLKNLRKDILKLTQEELSLKINMTRSNLGSIEIGRISLTDRVLSDICREFAVSPEWLIDGTEPVFLNNSDSMTSAIAEIYTSLSDDNKKYLRGYIDRLLEEQGL